MAGHYTLFQKAASTLHLRQPRLLNKRKMGPTREKVLLLYVFCELPSAPQRFVD